MRMPVVHPSMASRTDRLEAGIPAVLRWAVFHLALVSLAVLITPVRAEQNVVVVLDDSGSMDDLMRTSRGRVRRIDAAKQALIEVLSKLPMETDVGVLALNSQLNASNWIIPFGTGTPQAWLQNIRQLRAEGGTPLGQFLKIGADALLQARSQKNYGDYRLLVVTDGEANDPGLVDSYLPDILSRGLIVDVIGVDMQSDHSLATRVHNYRRADDDSALQQAISEVFAETSSASQDAETDFEILAALPDEFAERALKSLAARGNAPIEGRPTLGIGSSVLAPFSNTARANSASDFFSGLFCCFGGLTLLAVVVGMILKRRKPPRRRS